MFSVDLVKLTLKRKFFYLKFFFNKFFGHKFVRIWYGVKLKSNYQDNTFVCYFRGFYGQYYWDYLSGIDFDFIFFDIGANQGLYSIAAARNQFNVRTLAFEPVKSTFGLLAQNIFYNSLNFKCDLVNAAVAGESGFATIPFSTEHTGKASLAHTNSFTANGNFERIELIDGDFLSSLVVSFPKLPLVVKIDVEGFEPQVLSTLLSSSISAQIRDVFFEVDERWVDIEKVLELMKDSGFSRFDRIGSGYHYDIHAFR